MRALRFALVSLVVFGVVAGVALAQEFSVQSLSVNILEKVSEKYMAFEIKLTVQNSGGPGRIMVPVEGLDAEGKALETFVMSDSFGEGETKTLTEERTMPIEKFDSIKKWRTQAATKIPG